jgi:hypothetical protein
MYFSHPLVIKNWSVNINWDLYFIRYFNRYLNQLFNLFLYFHRPINIDRLINIYVSIDIDWISINRFVDINWLFNIFWNFNLFYNNLGNFLLDLHILWNLYYSFNHSFWSVHIFWYLNFHLYWFFNHQLFNRLFWRIFITLFYIFLEQIILKFKLIILPL